MTITPHYSLSRLYVYSMPEKPGTFLITKQKQSEDSAIVKENRLRCMLLNYICFFISNFLFPSFKGNAFKIHYRLEPGSFMQSNKLF